MQPGETDAWGGGILSTGGKLTMQNVVIECCTAQGAVPVSTSHRKPAAAGGNAYGGGLYIYGGTQNLNCITVQNNSALGGDGISGGGYGGYAYGGGIFATNIACLTLTGSKVLNNRADRRRHRPRPPASHRPKRQRLRRRHCFDRAGFADQLPRLEEHGQGRRWRGRRARPRRRPGRLRRLRGGRRHLGPGASHHQLH